MAARTLNAIVRMLEVLCSVVLLAMMLLTFVDVVGRYLLGAPVFGASEMISTMLALTIFLGLGIANARDKHIVVELVDHRVRSLAPRAYDVVVQGFSIAAMCLIVFVLFQQAIEAAHAGTTTIVLEWPLAWITGTVAGLAALSVVSQVLGLVVGRGGAAGHHLEDV
ncbi:TRAP transporter small permease [Tropicimonas sediminicola]|uniref:TRAP transporter small permease protein n=1 Tax=Tropicimonas sediminicola TaxID=1031541 RepID=A0A239FAY5_9RHOB|nr:TRAP transporter small permease [Tropicimonas sediminicola]SNS53668.1 TRAP-type C4-dicarboxylate transport system, small permease component [Tropicimonas sediminicola]